MSQENGIELEPAGLRKWLDSREVQLVDVRDEREFDAGHVPGARRIGFDQVSAEAGAMDKQTPLVFVCRSGNRSGMVAEAFRSGGFDAYHLAGGMLAWVDAGQALEPENGEVVERSVEDL